MKYEALTAEERRRLLALAPTVRELARIVRSSSRTASYVLTGGPVAPHVRARFLQAIAACQDNTVEQSDAKRD